MPAKYETTRPDECLETDASKLRARSSSPTAQRMRCYRERRREGLQYVRIPLRVTAGCLNEDQRQDGEALETALLWFVRNALDEMRGFILGRDARRRAR